MEPKEEILKEGRLKRWYPYITICVLCSFWGGIMAAIVMPIIIEDSKKQNVMRSSFIVRDNAELYSKDNPVVAVNKNVGPAIVEISNKGKYAEANHKSIEVNQGDGSGIIVDKQGYIVTNSHVVSNADKIYVTLANGKVLKAKLIGKDERTDIAVIKINASNLTVAKMGNSDNLAVGQLVIAIGNPLGKKYSHTVTAGILSAKNRIVEIGLQTFKLLQTDAAINPGNSGGALLNSQGEIIGINSAKIIGDKVEGIGFSIPINIAKPIITDIIKRGRVIRPWLGIANADTVAILNGPALNDLPRGNNGNYKLPPGHPSTMPVDKGHGVKIIVYPNTPAKKAGLQNDDVIIDVNNHKITTFFSLQQEIGSYQIGDKIKVTVLRNGKKVTREVTLEEMPEK